jgi:hypothetical protein
MQVDPGPGVVLFAPIDSATDPILPIPLESTDGSYHCVTTFTRDVPPLTLQELTDALTSPSCTDHLIAQSPVWGEIDEHLCPPVETEEGGCSASRADASVGILLALVAALARRR